MFEEKYRWIDPDPESTGVLLSDRIRFYVDKVRLIEDFDENSLGPAMYTLHLSDEYYLNDKRCRANEQNEIIIPKNGLIYVKLKEKLNIPYYMIAQHDLKVKQVYRGFLAGRSLQVDPGYSGHINYPIYNFTDEDKILKVGDAITAISFIKTTPFGRKSFWIDNKCNSEEELKRLTVLGIENYECLKMEKEKIEKDRTIPEYWLDFGGEEHISSVWRLREDFDSLEKKIKKREKISIWGAIGVLITFIGLWFRFFGILCSNIHWTADEIVAVRNQINEVSVTIKHLENDVTNLKKENKNKDTNQNLSNQELLNQKSNVETQSIIEK